ncbi:hypothetical protein ACFXHA_28220 [Nocardia sp. NPDC059240]|uniref:hypothetical protein n=1 Tax=Nocardia sp. NPDC059240 TaxID=3346786 RepID=UPI0036C67876
MAIAEVDQALARLDADHGEIRVNLAELEQHPGVRFLDGVPLTGVSAARWAAGRARLDWLWAQLGLLERVVTRAHEVRGRRARPHPAELAELTELLCGPSVELAPQPIPLGERDLLGPASVTRSITLAQLVAEMNAAYREVARLAAAAETVSSTFLPGVDRTGARLAEARRLADELELAEVGHSLPGRLDAVEARLNTARAQGMSDPLGLADGDPDGLTRDLDDVLAKLEELRARRAGVAGRMTQLGAAIDEAEAVARAAQAAAAITSVKILGFTAPALEPTGPLRDRLARLDHAGGHWTRLNDDVVALARDIDKAGTAADAARDQAQALLDRRDELRGRVDAYRAKGARLRLSEDPAVNACYQRAYELLHSAPCDLAAATRAVAEYQRAISEKTAG